MRCHRCKDTGFIYGPIHFPGFAPRYDWLPCSCRPVHDVGGYVLLGVIACGLALVLLCAVWS
jgi:hypothetical protein